MYRVYSGYSVYSMYYAKSSTSPMNSLTSLDWGSRFSWVFLFSFPFFLLYVSPLWVRKAKLRKIKIPQGSLTL